MVYCAGKEETLPLSSYSHEKVNDIFNVNFHGAFQLLRMFSKKKSCHDGASFVFLSSIMGELGQPGKTAYCSSKAAIIGLVRAAALELASRGIRVNSVSPGVVETPMTAHLFSIIGKEKEREIKSMHPLGFGKVDDIVSLISFLLSDNSKWITGQNFKIDGGYSIK
jgi:NAD(P)-dependent dehydrogenase (short-subunit alcohol dehydrogenase family)